MAPLIDVMPKLRGTSFIADTRWEIGSNPRSKDTPVTVLRVFLEVQYSLRERESGHLLSHMPHGGPEPNEGMFPSSGPSVLINANFVAIAADKGCPAQS